MKIGQTAKLVVKTKENFDISLINTIDFMLSTDEYNICKKYETDGEVEFVENEFLIPMTQIDSINLSQNEPCFMSLEAQINYSDKSVGKSKIATIKLDYSLHTNFITDAKPSDNQKIDTGLVL